MREDIFDEEQQIAAKRADDEARLAAVGLQHSIGELLTLQPAVTCAPTTSLRQAIEAMLHARIGCILVTDQRRLVGVFTERDVLTKVVMPAVDLDQQQVGALMTADPECLSREDELVYALNQMSVGGYRHVPIIDEQGYPIGVVSMRDIVDHLASLFPQEVLNLPPSPGHGIPRSAAGA